MIFDEFAQLAEEHKPEDVPLYELPTLEQVPREQLKELRVYLHERPVFRTLLPKWMSIAPEAKPLPDDFYYVTYQIQGVLGKLRDEERLQISVGDAQVYWVSDNQIELVDPTIEERLGVDANWVNVNNKGPSKGSRP